jgi:putative transcriptional regulator
MVTIRRRLGWTQAQAAERLGITQASYSKYETGERTPSLVMAMKISALFGVPVHVLFPDAVDDNSTSNPEDDPGAEH